MSAQACVEAFEMGGRETAKAWHSTSLLSIVKVERIAELLNAFELSRPLAISECLTSIAGPSYDAFALKFGADGTKFVKMHKILVQLLATDLLPVSKPKDVLVELGVLRQRAIAWISDGVLPELRTGEDLRKINDLINGGPEGRLALLAPLAPAISSAEVVLRARVVDFPFPEAQRP
jgi:hypothetical protein